MKKEKDHKLYRKMGFYERYIKRAIDIFALDWQLLYSVGCMQSSLCWFESNWEVQCCLLNIDLD